MTDFKYRHKGTANDSWNEDVIEAESKEEALEKLNNIYGTEEIKNGAVQVEIIND